MSTLTEKKKKGYRIIEGDEAIQGSEAWHQFRKGKIGASDAASIMGVSPWETRLEAWERIALGKSKPKTDAMDRGTRLEGKAREWINGVLQMECVPVVIQSVSHPDLIASLDGYIDVNGNVAILEIKCPGMSTHTEALKGKIPDHYYPQLQHQMDMVDVNEMWYISFDGNQGVILKCKRDEEYCKDLFFQELTFLASLINFRPPEATDKDWVRIVDPVLDVKAERYKELTRLADEVDIERDMLKKELIEEAGHPRSRIGDLSIQKVIRKGVLDYERIAKDSGIEDLERYRKLPIETWRISTQ